MDAENWREISEKEIEDMLYLITAYGNRREGKRFDSLKFAQRQKVTLILRKRAKRTRNKHQPLDFYIIREVIDDAQRNFFIFD